jgi:hypothetical protein
MAKGKGTGGGNHWDELSDEELLQTELTTDDPESLDGLVKTLPDGYKDSYVEYAYNLRGSDREEFICVHGHHRHLAGFVMRKDDQRWLVGWMCGESIYDEKFDEYKADYNSAVNRRGRLQKRREIENLTRPLTQWLNEAYASSAFEQYQSVRGQLKAKLPWVWGNARRVLDGRTIVGKLDGPQTFFSSEVDPKKSFRKVIAEIDALNVGLTQEDNLTEERASRIKRMMRNLINRVEVIFRELRELVDAFQPNVLQVVCDAANKRDNSKKRQYTFGLLSITCKRQKESGITVQVPQNFSLPNCDTLNAVKKALEAS